MCVHAEPVVSPRAGAKGGRNMEADQRAPPWEGARVCDGAGAPERSSFLNVRVAGG